MDNNFILRQANDSDIDFLIEAILNAEMSGTDTISYCNIFSVSKDELMKILHDVLEEDIQGQELCVSDFLIAIIDGERAGAVCAWVEGAEGTSSALLKSSIFFHFFGKEKCEQAAEKLKIAEQLAIHREQTCIQIESVYVCKKFRGLGISNKLICQHIKNYAAIDNSLEKVQILLAKTNESAYRSYEKIGFKITCEKQADNQEILKILPSDTMIQMESLIKNILNNK